MSDIEVSCNVISS